ncbi:hypothetical protein AVEN_71998-1 [Araneus ventricosus]|uniref:Uncharacterized protein n=1 Tax=Araneus ventricosus TaxID=182803 RepID=A0A4Y2DEQ5_ARAVE|nr:hypothetical protein AVEN_71998-1 [Araneus ventricosus]
MNPITLNNNLFAFFFLKINVSPLLLCSDLFITSKPREYGPPPAWSGGAARELNDSDRCDSSSAETGVLVANHLATARPFPKEARTITGGSVATPHHYCAIRGGKNLLTYKAASHP